MVKVGVKPTGSVEDFKSQVSVCLNVGLLNGRQSEHLGVYVCTHAQRHKLEGSRQEVKHHDGVFLDLLACRALQLSCQLLAEYVGYELLERGQRTHELFNLFVLE